MARRVVLVLADGLRPDAVTPGLMPSLHALSEEFVHARVSTAVGCAEMGAAARSIAWALVTAAGVGRLVVEGEGAGETAAAASGTLAEPGLTIVYLPDCDRAGHAHGWMSGPYQAAAADVDHAVGYVWARAEDAVMMVLSDHGGGGVYAHDHDLPHPLNDRITLIMAGPTVRRHHAIERDVSILDVPPTVLWYFGLPLPVAYEGRVLGDAFVQAPAMAVA